MAYNELKSMNSGGVVGGYKHATEAYNTSNKRQEVSDAKSVNKVGKTMTNILEGNTDART
jgi:hypothetical protein